MWQKAKNIYHHFTAFLFNVYYGFPANKLVVVGVTGTSGKTTTTHMIYEILKKAGFKVSLLSTIKAVIGGIDYDTGFHVTTPDPHKLPKYLYKAVRNGDTHFILEVSSHALDQNRVSFIHFNVGVLTSLAHEHLDYHKTFINYAKAKFKLLHASDMVILPEDSIKDEIKPYINYSLLEKKVRTFGFSKGDETQKKWDLKLKSSTEFNILNGLAAASVAYVLGIHKKTIKDALANFESLPGRFEEIPTSGHFKVIIDFAHKPDALKHALIAARARAGKDGKVIALFGCASERDILKRSMMGELSGKLADVTILTDEDPRHEDSMKIINEIAVGCVVAGASERSADSFSGLEDKKTHIFFKIPNRKDAILFAIKKVSRKRDVVLLCGKGHEKSMNYKGVEVPWSEHNAVKEALVLQ